MLPLIPAYLSFLTGSSLEELKAESDAASRARVMLHALAFVAGFTVVFMVIGLSASALGSFFASDQILGATVKDWIARIGGVIVIILGLNMIGLFKIPALMMDKRVQVRSANRSFFASFLVGIGFAAGWSPCIGPILSLIILKASQEQYATAAAAAVRLLDGSGGAVPHHRRARSRRRWARSTASSAISARSRSAPARSWSRPAS